MRHFDKSVAYTALCHQAVQDVPYPIQAIWGADDPGLRFERYGREVEEIADLKEISKLSAKHLLQEENWQEIADRIASLAKASAK